MTFDQLIGPNLLVHVYKILSKVTQFTCSLHRFYWLINLPIIFLKIV